MAPGMIYLFSREAYSILGLYAFSSFSTLPIWANLFQWI